MPQIGDAAPDAHFTHPDGSAGKISDYKGKALVVYFYPKDATTGCTREAQDFTALASEFSAANTVVLGISKDSEKSHVKFIEKYDLNIALGTDGDGSLCDAFGVWVEKSMYGRQYMGIERATFLIDASGVVQGVWRKVKVAGHAEAVLKAAQGL
jgi:peroxiredoxin Q/BCP